MILIIESDSNLGKIVILFSFQHKQSKRCVELHYSTMSQIKSEV